MNDELTTVPTELTFDQARQLTDRIKTDLVGVCKLITLAFETNAWSTLEYRSWEDYCENEFHSSIRKLPKPVRQDLVIALTDGGATTREAGAAAGVSHTTVENDLKERKAGKNLPDEEPDLVAVHAKCRGCGLMQDVATMYEADGGWECETCVNGWEAPDDPEPDKPNRKPDNTFAVGKLQKALSDCAGQMPWDLAQAREILETATQIVELMEE